MLLKKALVRVLSMFTLICMLLGNINIAAWAKNGRDNADERRNRNGRIKQELSEPEHDEDIRKDLYEELEELEPQEFKTNRYIVKYKEVKNKGKAKNQLGNKVRESKSNKNKSFKNKSFELIELNEEVKPEDFNAEIKSMDDSEEIEYIQPDHIISMLSYDIEVNDQWAIFNTETVASNSNPDGFRIDANVLSAWDETQGEGVLIALIDSGVDITHPNLSTNMWTNTSEIQGNGIDDDGNGFIDDYRGYDFFNNKIVKYIIHKTLLTNNMGHI